MEQQGLKNKDLISILWNKSRVTDILKKHRKLTMVRNLHEKLNIPLESLITEY
jgi:HTH-type transcriptional regulator/antitoxin HigA